jgi:hypothetical protein
MNYFTAREISGFRREVEENRVLLCHYVACSTNFLKKAPIVAA